MYEIEAKVWVKNEKVWKKIAEKIKSLALFKKEVLKEDLYFGFTVEKKASFRLRTIDGQKHEVTIKDKQILQGIEQSKEDSFIVDDKNAFLEFTKKIGLSILLNKTKHSQIFHQDEIIIELNTVKGLGNFVEIEILCESKKDTQKAKEKIVNLFTTLGFSEKDFEERPYMELLVFDSAQTTTPSP